MAKLEIFQNGTSMHPDRMGDPIYQIGTKNSDGEYDVVVFDAMTEKEAKSRLKELQPIKTAASPKPAVEKKVVSKKAPEKKKVAKKKTAKKKAAKKKTAKKK